MLDSIDVKLENVNFKGKYSFQYIKNLDIINCNLYKLIVPNED